MTSGEKEREPAPARGKRTAPPGPGPAACRQLGAAAALVLLLGPPALPAAPAETDADGGEQRRAHYALCVGFNHDEKLEPLRYADDDAVRTCEYLAALGGRSRVAILAELDEESERLYRGLEIEPPGREQLERAMKRLAAGMARDARLGRRVTFTFFYSGHGNIRDGQGYINLKGKPAKKGGKTGKRGRCDPFTAADLRRVIIEGSPAAVNHVIIDACNSYFMINAKGPGGVTSRIQRQRKPIADAFFARHRSTGVILSTSGNVNVYEPPSWQSGLFTHLFLSGLKGGADANGDGKVTYPEIWAFVENAFARVQNRKYSPKIYARAPGVSVREPLVELAEVKGKTLVLPPAFAGRFYLDDGRLLRYADLTKPRGVEVQLKLIAYQAQDEDGASYTLYDANPRPDGKVKQFAIALADASLPERSELIMPRFRGAEERVFEQILTAPFGPAEFTRLSRRYRQHISLSSTEDVGATFFHGPQAAFGVWVLHEAIPRLGTQLVGQLSWRLEWPWLALLPALSLSVPGRENHGSGEYDFAAYGLELAATYPLPFAAFVLYPGISVGGMLLGQRLLGEEQILSFAPGAAAHLELLLPLWQNLALRFTGQAGTRLVDYEEERRGGLYLTGLAGLDFEL